MPAGQVLHVEGAAAPTKVLNVPAPQRVQVAVPVALDHVPAGHCSQEVLPVLGLYFPASHAMQDAGADEYVPTGQDETHDAAPAMLYKFAAHNVHEAAPELEKVPAGHSICFALVDPGGQ